MKVAEHHLKRPAYIYTTVLGIAALLGAIQAIGGYFDWIFSAPHLVFKWDKTRIQLIEGGEFLETSSLISYVPVAHRAITLSASLKSTSAAELPVDVHPTLMPHLAGDASKEISISGKAPAPGSYELLVNASARAGIIRAVKVFQSEQPVTVWPKIPRGSLSVRNVQDDKGILVGSVAVGTGAPNGLDCELEIKGVPGLQYDDLYDFKRLRGVPRWRTAETSGNEVASLVWEVLPVSDYEELRFHVVLFRRVETDWNNVCQRAMIWCYYR